MRKNIKTNYIFNVSYQILLMAVPIITAPYLSRVLGAEGIGKYSYAYAMVSYFTLFAVMGTSTFGQRAVSYVQEDPIRRSEAFWETFMIRVILAVITLGVFGVYLFRTDGELPILAVLGLNIFNVVFDISWFLQGMEEFSKTVLRSVIFKILQVLFIFLFIKTPDDLLLYVGGTSVLTVLGSVSLWVYLPRYIDAPRKIRPFRNMKTILELFVPTIAIQIYTVLDKTMIGWFTDTSLENGYYEQAEKIVKMCMTVITALGTVMLPRMANTYKAKDTEKFREYLYTSYRFVWFLGIPMFFGIIATSDLFTVIFFGEGFDKVKILLPIFSFLVVIIPLGYVTGGQYLVAAGKQNILSRITFIGAGVNVCLNLALIPFFYSVGAAVSSVVAELCVTIFGFLYLKKFDNIKMSLIFRECTRYWISGFIMFMTLIVCRLVLQDGIIKLMLLIFIGGSIYFAGLWILKDKFMMYIISFIRRILTSRFHLFRK